MLCSAAKGALLSTNAPGRLASMGAAVSDPGAHPGPAATARTRWLGKFARGADGRWDAWTAFQTNADGPYGKARGPTAAPLNGQRSERRQGILGAAAAVAAPGQVGAAPRGMDALITAGPGRGARADWL